MIRKDSVDEFKSYIKKNNLSLDDSIEPSIFETNPFLLKKYETSLIEYAAFFGSIQIFNFLRMNGIELEESLWYYAIHSQNIDIICLLYENSTGTKNESYKNYFYESIKCHHNDLANFFTNAFIDIGDENSHDASVQILKNHNFAFTQSLLINESLFHNLCRYDHYSLAFIVLKIYGIDINKKLIYKSKISMKFKNNDFNKIQKR